MHNNTNATIHYPRPACVPHSPRDNWQRRFGPVSTTDSNYCTSLEIENSGARTEIEVFRSAYGDSVRVDVRIGHPTLAELCLRMFPAELRDLAARLIDAAHDIETFPAATLAAAAPEGGVA